MRPGGQASLLHLLPQGQALSASLFGCHLGYPCHLCGRSSGARGGQGGARARCPKAEEQRQCLSPPLTFQRGCVRSHVRDKPHRRSGRGGSRGAAGSPSSTRSWEAVGGDGGTVPMSPDPRQLSQTPPRVAQPPPCWKEHVLVGKPCSLILLLLYSRDLSSWPRRPLMPKSKEVAL